MGGVSTVALLLLGCSPGGGGGGGQEGSGPPNTPPRIVRVAPDVPRGGTPGPTGSLNRAVAAEGGRALFHLEPGHYYLEPEPAPGHDVPMTVSLVLTGHGSGLIGTAPDSVVIHTGTATGLLFDHCDGCTLRGVTVTGGIDDAGPRAVNGAIVVQASDVTLQRCRIHGNGIARHPAPGVAGVVAEAGGRIELLTCRIEGNSGDGIALYGGSQAEVRSTVIDGARDVAGGPLAAQGMGVRVTSGARAVVEESRIARFQRGIGIFGDARAQIRENVVEETTTWGIAIEGSGGAPSAFVEDNVVFRAGACGIVVNAPVAGSTEGSVVRNAVVESGFEPLPGGHKEICAGARGPLVRRAIPPDWPVQGNLFHGNRAGASHETELDLDTFIARAMRLYTFEIEPQPATTGSLFMEAYRERFGPPFR